MKCICRICKQSILKTNESLHPYAFKSTVFSVTEMGQLILSITLSPSPVLIASQGHITICVCLWAIIHSTTVKTFRTLRTSNNSGIIILHASICQYVQDNLICKIFVVKSFPNKNAYTWHKQLPIPSVPVILLSLLLNTEIWYCG